MMQLKFSSMPRAVVTAIVVFCLAVAGGCSSGWNPADDKAAGSSNYQATSDGRYRVRRGDTLHAIAFNFNKDWRDIAKWNNIRSPYTIYPDQELVLFAPKGTASQKGVTTAAVAPRGTTTTEPLESRSTTTSKPVAKSAPAKSSSSTATPDTAAASSKSTTPAPVAAGDPKKWLWPAEGRIISNFKPNDPARKGIDIGGKEGQAVIAGAAGEVVYSGSGLIGYGELVIIKHSERVLSAYAHNRKRLVKEGQKVAAGELIAEMGRTDRNKAMLHFEIRVNGNPQDPLKYLPKR
jgi:lipoprotein NlpD